MKKKIIYSLFLSIIFCFCFNICVFAAENEVIEVSSLDELNAAKQQITADTSNKAYTISLTQDITNVTFNWNDTKHKLTIDGNGHTMYAPSTYDSCAIYMNEGHLILKNVVLEGGNTNRSTAGIYMGKAAGTVTIEEGTVIQNFKVDNFIGAGIALLRGKVIMNGGTIQNNQIYSGSVHAGAGVGINGQGVFELNGGVIQNNHITSTYYASLQPSYGGGVAVVNGGQFYMHGGTIKGNSANVGGGVGVTHYVQYYTSTFYMDGGVIEDNFTIDNAQHVSIGGVCVNGYYDRSAAMVAPDFSQFPLQFVSNPGVYLKGGTIQNNEAVLGGGGIGIMFTSLNGNIPVIENMIIKENNGGGYGGGIYGLDVSGYTGNAVISGNTMVYNNEAEEGADIFTDSGCRISGLTNPATYNATLNRTGMPITAWYEDYYGEEGEERWAPDHITNVFTENECYSDDEIGVAIIAAHGPVYTITYKDGVEGSVFEDCEIQAVENATTPEYPNEISRDGYVFSGWTPEIAEKVTESVTYTATWKEDKNNNGRPDDEEERYVVKYIDGVEGEVFEQVVIPGLLPGTDTPTYEDVLERDGYVFEYWSPEISEIVTSDEIYTAVWARDENNNKIPDYKEEKFTVTYSDGADGEAFEDYVINNILTGMPTPEFVGEPVREGYTFIGWSPVVAETVTESVTYVAEWEAQPIVNPDEKEFIVRYKDGVDGTLFKDVVFSAIEIGEKTPEFTGKLEREGYIFKGWSPKVEERVLGNATYVAMWEKVDAPEKVEGTETGDINVILEIVTVITSILGITFVVKKQKREI